MNNYFTENETVVSLLNQEPNFSSYCLLQTFKIPIPFCEEEIIVIRK